MNEAILIEIAQRFRRMEDVIEDACMIMAAYREAYPFTAAGMPSAGETITKLGRSSEACCDDMVLMQEHLRKRSTVAA
jgi:hypothetical protein